MSKEKEHNWERVSQKKVRCERCGEERYISKFPKNEQRLLKEQEIALPPKVEEAVQAIEETMETLPDLEVPELFPCPECEKEFANLRDLRAHLKEHIPKREKYADTVLKVLTDAGGSMEIEQLAAKCHEINPSNSQSKEKRYIWECKKLVKAKKVRIVTTISIVKE